MALGHYQFETLHPFIDGNGRMGRLIAQLRLMEGGALSQPMLNLSPYLQRRGDEYRQELRAVSATGDLERWILFLLEALATQAKAAVTRAGRLLELRSQMVAEVRAARISGVALRITEGLVEYPAVTPTTASQQYGVTYQAANTAIDRLVNIGLLQEVTGKKYGRLFLAMRVIGLLEDVTSGAKGSGRSRRSFAARSARICWWSVKDQATPFRPAPPGSRHGFARREESNPTF